MDKSNQRPLGSPSLPNGKTPPNFGPVHVLVAVLQAMWDQTEKERTENGETEKSDSFQFAFPAKILEDIVRDPNGRDFTVGFAPLSQVDPTAVACVIQLKKKKTSSIVIPSPRMG